MLKVHVLFLPMKVLGKSHTPKLATLEMVPKNRAAAST